MQLLFFPLSVIALALMAAMLMIYVGSTWLLVPGEEHREDQLQPPAGSLAIPIEFPNPDHSLPIDPPPPEPEKRPSGGIAIEK